VSFPDPATILASDSVAGQRVYRRAGGCIPCHGARGEGITRLGSAIADKEWTRGDGSLASIYEIIRDGIADPGASRSPMPAAGGRLSTKDIFLTAAYVYTLSHSAATVVDSAALPAGAPPIAQAPPDTLQHPPR
jgi:mono/diheme cytochrome c family protein